jgi:hypothetical protein
MVWIALIVLAVMLPDILSSVLESRLGRALATRIEGRSGAGDGGSEMRVRVQELESEVDRLTTEVHRLAEAEEFLQRLLVERSAPPGPSSGPASPRSSTPASSPPTGEG